jgi:hypothetical protein
MPETYVGTSGAAGSAGIWTIIVTIAGVDVTARIVGDIRIDAEEDSARVADLTIAPASTSFTVAAWVGKPITIDIAAMHTGSPTSVERLFTGIIDTPVLDLAGRRIGLRCTDDLQGVVEAMDAAAIDAAIPDGYYSPAIFDPAARGWSRAQDRLSTVPASLDLTPSRALRLTAWAPKFAADLAFTAAHLLDNSLSVSIAGAHDLTNSVAIDFGYRFPRVKAETYAVGYDYVNAGTISDFSAALSWFLQRSAVESAIKSAGAKIVAISYTPLPSSGIGSWIPSLYDAELCMGFTSTVTFDYGQTIEERHAITVSAPNSIAAVGTRSDRLSGALEGVYPPIVAAETSMLLYGNAISSIPPQDTAAGVIGQTVAADVTLTPDSDRAAADAAMETLIAIAKTKIWASHRHNTVSASVALNPSIDVDKTIAISAPGITAQGKCRSLTHRLSPETGEATTDFAIALCSVAGTGVGHDETPTAAPAGSTPAATTLADAPIVDFNYLAAEDHILTITFPGVETAERELAVIDIATSYLAPLVEDIFTVTL